MVEFPAQLFRVLSMMATFKQNTGIKAYLTKIPLGALKAV